MPRCSGGLDASLELFLDQARVFFEAKNIDYDHASNHKRDLAMVVANLRVQAAAWYYTQQTTIENIQELATRLRREFIPADIQERLRNALYNLKQRERKDLIKYVTQCRHLICRVEGMGDLDKNTYFTLGLVTKTKEDVGNRRCSTVHNAIDVAIEYERAHPQNTLSSLNEDPRRGIILVHYSFGTAEASLVCPRVLSQRLLVTSGWYHGTSVVVEIYAFLRNARPLHGSVSQT